MISVVIVNSVMVVVSYGVLMLFVVLYCVFGVKCVVVIVV